MTYQVYLTQLAVNDLHSIYVYVAQTLSAPQTAARLLTHLETAINNLASFPTRCRVVADRKWFRRGLRVLVVDNYLVFYLVDQQSKQVRIMRIVYGGRDYTRLLADF